MFHVKKRCHGVGMMLAALLMLCIAVFSGSFVAFAAEDEGYTLTYLLDGEAFTEQKYQQGETPEAPEAPEKEKFVFTEWKNLPKVMPAQDMTVTGSYNFAGTIVTDLENIYECELVVSEDLAVTMYLRIDEEGNFVFSRNTDFSDTEKGAGKMFKQTPAGDLEAGAYSVDISWSPMAEMFAPVLDIDTENMTFILYSASDPDTEKGNGSISFEDDVYTMHFADGENTTEFTYEDGVITFTSKLWYGSASFNSEDEAGNFVPYTAKLEEEAEAEAEETAAKETGAEAEPEETKYYFVYYIVNGEQVVEGDYISEFEIGEDGRIIFVSPFWFGATEPKFTEEGSEEVAYPEFMISEEKLIADIDKEAIISKSMALNAENAADSVGSKDGASAFKTGTYGGTYSTTAMGNPLVYACTITFNADGTYFYSVKFHVMGSDYNETDNGTYTINGSSITLTGGKSMSGSISGNTVTLTGYLSSFAFSPATVTFTYGYSPSVSSSPATTPDNGKESEKETESNADPVVSAEGLVGGKYAVDISWSPMASMFSPILDIDAKNMTFNLYNKGASGTSRGSGTIKYAKGVFTLNYTTGKKTKFTFKDGVITFTSKLWYGSASFNNENASGKFVPYTATLMGTGTASETEKETEKPVETEPGGNETAVLKTGTYSGTYTKTAMGSQVVYAYSMILNADSTYRYSVTFNMMGNEYNESENGTYKVDGSTLMLVAADGTQMAGTVNSNGTISVTRKVSSFAADTVALNFVYGDVPETNESESEKESEKETENETESEKESESEAEGETTALASGKYTVDISWSPMGAMITPVLDIDAAAMTFNVYGESAPDASKGSGTITCAAGVYTLNYENGNTTTFTYAKGVITFTSKLWYGAASFNNADDNGNFVPYTGTVHGSGNEPGTGEGETAVLASGKYAVDISWSPMGAMMSPILEIDALAMTFDVYNASAPETSKGSGTITSAEGVYTLNYESGNTTTFTYANGVITFTSKLWYGAVTFNNVDDDGNFVPYTGTIGGDESGAAKTVENRTYAAKRKAQEAENTEAEGETEPMTEAAMETEAAATETETETEAATETGTETEEAAETETETEETAATETETETEPMAEVTTEANTETIAE